MENNRFLHLGKGPKTCGHFEKICGLFEGSKRAEEINLQRTPRGTRLARGRDGPMPNGPTRGL